MVVVAVVVCVMVSAASVVVAVPGTGEVLSVVLPVHSKARRHPSILAVRAGLDVVVCVVVLVVVAELVG